MTVETSEYQSSISVQPEEKTSGSAYLSEDDDDDADHVEEEALLLSQQVPPDASTYYGSKLTQCSKRRSKRFYALMLLFSTCILLFIIHPFPKTTYQTESFDDSHSASYNIHKELHESYPYPDQTSALINTYEYEGPPAQPFTSASMFNGGKDEKL